jgi:hypothetical protein
MRIDSAVNRIGLFFCHGIISFISVNMFFEGQMKKQLNSLFSFFVSSKMGETYSV